MVLTFKLVLGLLTVGLTWPIVRFLERKQDISDNTFELVALTLLAVSRIGIFLLIFFIMSIPATSDVVVYYQEGVRVLAGGSPMIDFNTAYGPLFDYFVAGVLRLWNAPTAIILCSILIELFSFPIWLRIGRAVGPELMARRSAMLYVLNPLAISTVAIAGQNHVWLSLFLALSILLLFRKDDLLSGMSLGLSIVAVKFLSLLFAPALLVASRVRWSWLFGFIATATAGYVIPLYWGAKPWEQVLFHALYDSSGSLPYLLSALGIDIAAPRARLGADLAAFIALCFIFLFSIWRNGPPRGSNVVFMCAFVLITTLVLQKKSFTTYLVIVLFPLTMLIAVQIRFYTAAIIFQLFAALATIEPSLWFRWMHESDLSGISTGVIPDGVTTPHLFIFFNCELVLITGYGVLLAMLWKQMGNRRVDRMINPSAETMQRPIGVPALTSSQS